MRTSRIGKGGIAAAFAATLALPLATPSVADDDGPGIKHILVISVDGMHQADLDWYLKNHPNSALAKLTGTGVQYTANSTSRPSDSFPGLLAFFTGGTPISHGVFYDDSYDHTLYPPSAANGGKECSGPAGTEVSNFEYLDSSWNIAAGQVTDLWNVLDPTHMAGRMEQLATPGSILLTADTQGDLFALDAKTGALLLRRQVGAGAMDGGLITYEVNGRQFIAVGAGDNNPTYKVKGDNAIVILGLP